MDTDAMLGRLQQATTLQGDDAAIRIHAEYEPQAGRSAKVFPPTYLPSNESRYHIEERWLFDGDEPQRANVVVLDSYQSQANRCEAALFDRIEDLRLPHLVTETEIRDQRVSISSLQAPHRSRDAYFLDSLLQGAPFDESEVGLALGRASEARATPFLQVAPYDLVYGVWDSHRGNRVALKFPRAYTPEMLGWHVEIGDRAATKGDPYNLASDSVSMAEWRPQDDRKERRMSEIGHGMVPGTLGTFRSRREGEQFTAPGVSVQRITRLATLSLAGLARFQFPVEPNGDATAAGRTALAALALLADRLAFGGAGLHLRSGSDLVLVNERLEWVMRGGDSESIELTRDDALALFEGARERLRDAGVDWAAEPVRLEPTDRLRNAIERTLHAVELDADV